MLSRPVGAGKSTMSGARYQQAISEPIMALIGTVRVDSILAFGHATVRPASLISLRNRHQLLVDDSPAALPAFYL